MTEVNVNTGAQESPYVSIGYTACIQIVKIDNNYMSARIPFESIPNMRKFLLSDDGCRLVAFVFIR